MNNNQESNYFIPILSAIAGIGAIVTVFSPFLLQNNQIARIFIDPNTIQFASIISIIIAVITIWYASSNQSYELFSTGKSILFKLTIVFVLLCISFYALLQMANNKLLNTDFASVLQLGIYIFGYLTLGLIVGILLRDSFGGYRYQKIQAEKYDRFRDALFKSGLLKTELKIESIIQRPYNNNEPQFFGAHNVLFTTEKGKFFAIISSDYSQILHSEEIKQGVENHKSKK